MNNEQILIDAIGGDSSPANTALIFVERHISMWKTVADKKNVICEDFIRKNFDLPLFNNGFTERGLLIIKRDDSGNICVEIVDKGNEYGDYWWDWSYADSNVLSGSGMSPFLESIMDNISDGDDWFNIAVNFYTQSSIQKIIHKYSSRLREISKIIECDYQITIEHQLSSLKTIFV